MQLAAAIESLEPTLHVEQVSQRFTDGVSKKGNMRQQATGEMKARNFEAAGGHFWNQEARSETSGCSA